MTNGRSDLELDALLRETPATSAVCLDEAGPDFDAIAARHEGSLSPEATETLSAHLRDCRLCRELDLQFAELTASDPLADVDPATIDRVAQAVDQRFGSHEDVVQQLAASPTRTRSRWRHAVVAALAAALVLGAVTLVFLPSPPGYTIRVVTRGRPLATRRSRSDSPAPGDSGKYGPQSIVAYDVTVSMPPDAAEPVLQVYVEGPEGRLERVTPSIRTNLERGEVRYVVEGLGRDFFGEVAGARSLWFGVAASPRAFGAVDGQRPEAPETDDITWARVEVEYVLAAAVAPPEAALFGALASGWFAGTQMTFFDTTHRPRVRLAGRGTWTLTVADGRETHELARETLNGSEGARHVVLDLPWVAPRRATLVAAADGVERRRWSIVWGPLDHPDFSARFGPLYAKVDEGRAAFRSGRRGDAQRAWRRAIELAEASDVLSEASRRRSALAYVALSDDRFDDALRLLDAARADAQKLDSAELLAEIDYYEALVHLERRGNGAFVAAERLLRSSISFAEYKGDTAYLQQIVQPLVTLWSQYGRAAEAVRLLRRYPPPPDADDLAHGHYFGNLAGALYHANRTGQMTVARDTFDDAAHRALRHLQSSGTKQFEANVRALIARASLDANDESTARAQVDALLAMANDERTEVRWEIRLLGAELALTEGRREEAIERARSIEADAFKAHDGEDSWVACAARALRGRVHDEAGRTERARADYLASTQRLRVLRRKFVSAPAQASMLADESDLHRRTLGALLEAGLVEQAVEHVSQRRAEVLVGLAGDAARIEAMDLAAVRSRLGDRRALVIAARSHREPVSFWISSSKIDVARGDDAMKQWKARAATVDHIYISPGSEGSAFDFTLPSDGATVSWVPHAGVVGRSPTSSASGAIVVADPNRDLAFAEREGRSVAARLTDARLLIHEGATRAAVLDALGAVRLFHFAGHGQVGRNDPWSARLRLADGDLTIHDIFEARPSGIHVAVLVGCSTGEAQREGSDGLPQALLTAGVRTVVASVDGLEDSPELGRFVAAFYAAGGEETPGEAFRIAAAASAAGRSFRLWGEP
ncbi:MAG: CHAT domain-containing protein [Deltaproteobacteria bacterium]